MSYFFPQTSNQQPATAMNYETLEIYQKATDLFLRVHRLSLLLPKHEMYELGSQLRRSADSVGTNIVEGYGRRRYKQDFIRFLVYSQSSSDETIYHLEKLKLLYPLIEDLTYVQEEYQSLGAQINSFISYVEKNWRT